MKHNHNKTFTDPYMFLLDCIKYNNLEGIKIIFNNHKFDRMELSLAYGFARDMGCEEPIELILDKSIETKLGR